MNKSKGRLDESKVYFNIFNNWRRMDFLSTMFAMVGLVIAIINYEIDIATKEMEFDLDDIKKYH